MWFYITFVIVMNGEKRQTIKIRIISVCFAVVVLAVFKPFGLDVWQWQAYAHLVVVGGLGILSCILTEAILVYMLKRPGSLDRGVDYIISISCSATRLTVITSHGAISLRHL